MTWESDLANKANSAASEATAAQTAANTALTAAANMTQVVSWIGDAAVNVPAISVGGTQTVTATWSSPGPTTDYTVACAIIFPAASLTLLGNIVATPILTSRTTTTCQFTIKNTGLVSLSLGTVVLHAIGARGYRPT